MIGATFAIISALFGAMFVVVVMTAIGREVTEELDAAAPRRAAAAGRGAAANGTR